MVASWRSLLFVPGDRSDRHDAALASRADAVCFDLEDAVAPGAKGAARTAVVDRVGRDGSPLHRITVRLNDVRTIDGQADAGAFIELGITPAALLLPKVQSSDQVERVFAMMAAAGLSPALIPLIETAAGLASAIDIASAPGVAAILFGGADLSADLGCALEWEPLQYARSRVVHAAAVAAVTAIDMPCLIIDDLARLQSDCARARATGFAGKAAIHPSQIEAIHLAFTPSSEETERALRIVKAAEASADGVVVLNGRMVDAAVIRHARRTLDRARTIGLRAD